MSAGITRVNYFADNFGFVGWETFSSHDLEITEKVVQYNKYQMSKMINEDVYTKVVRM